MFGALKPGFETCMATLKLVMNAVGELLTEKNSCGIARFPCDSTAFLFQSRMVEASQTAAKTEFNAKWPFKVMHFRITEKLTKDCVSLYNNTGLISKVSEK